MKNFTKLIILLILAIFCLNATAQEFYANLTFEVQNEGNTIISGTTNSFELTPQNTQELTNKNGKIWTLFIDTNEIFSEYSYKIILPVNSQIQKIQTNSNYFLSTQNSQIIIEGFGENVELKIEIEYTINQIEQNTQLIAMLAGLIVLIIIGIVLFILIKKNKAKTTPIGKETNNNENIFDENALSQRQLDIVKQLEKKKGQTTQAEIQKILSLPKASLFRNLAGLEKKGIIKKERKGMTMLITLQKKRRS
jgi:uncharacterized membrane protein